MGSCCSKSEPRGLEGTRQGRLWALLRRLRPRGNPPLAETVELDGHLTDERRTSHNSGDEVYGAATSQLRKNLEDRESQTELSQSHPSEMANSLTRAERDLDSITQQRNETEASLHTQNSHLQARTTDTHASKEKLELRDLVNELYEVTDWFHFGLQLGVPPPQLRVIDRNTVHDNVRGRSFMLEDWLNQEGSKASWADIIAALLKIKMGGLAKRLADKYGVPMPPADETAQAAQQVSGSGHNEESPSTKEQLLSFTHTLCETLERHDKKQDDIKVSMETAKKDQQTPASCSRVGEVERDRAELQAEVNRERREVDRRLMEAAADDYLDSILADERLSRVRLGVPCRDDHILNIARQIPRWRSLAPFIGLNELDEETIKESGSVEVQRIKMLRKWREKFGVGATYLNPARGLANIQRRDLIEQLCDLVRTTEEPAQEIEYQHDQAMELLSESSELEATCRQDHSQSELENLNLTWGKCARAPERLRRGSAVIDIDRHTAYFTNYSRVYAYEWQSKEEKWSKLPDIAQPCHALAVVNGLLTAVGGKERREGMNIEHSSISPSLTVSELFPSPSVPPSRDTPTNTLLSLVGEGSERKWEKHFPPMPTKRTCTAAVYSGKHLVVIGGKGGDNARLTTVEVMNTETREWFPASNLPFPLSAASVTIVGDNIYLVGWLDENGQTRSVLTCSLTALLQSCQPHPPSLWHLVADTPVYQSTCVTLDGELVAVGGCDSDGNPTDAVYAYNPHADADPWNVISHMNTARWKCLAAVLPGDRLMVVGGYSTKSFGSLCDVVEIATLAVA